MARDWARRRTEDYRAGILAALFRNANRPKNAKAVGPEDFFPSLREQETKPAVNGRRGLTPEQLLAVFQVVTGTEITH